MKNIVLVGLIFFGFSSFLLAQEIDTTNWVGVLKYKRSIKIENGKPLFTPIVGPAYTPELGLAFAGGVMMSFKTNLKDSLLKRSSMPIMIGLSSTGAFFINSNLTSFWLQDKLRIYNNFVYKDMPDNYWGVGYDKAYNTPKSDTTTLYQKTWWQINPKILWQFSNNHFLGINIDINYTQGRNPSQVVANDPYYLKYNNKPFNSGLGLVYQYDSRDMPVNAWSGWFFELNATLYNEALGGNNNYQMLSLDYRKFIKIKRKGQTLALHSKARLTRGNVPYGEMSQLGSPFDLRGYTWGRYRHENMFFIIPEYRHTFRKRDQSLSKHGTVAWVGTGTLGEKVSDFKSWLPNAGIGYRYEIQPRMNVRFDVGIGKESMGFYFNFNEAF